MSLFSAALVGLMLIPAPSVQEPDQSPLSATVRSYDVRLLERIGARRGIGVEAKSHLLWVWQGLEGWGLPGRTYLPLSDSRGGSVFELHWPLILERFLPRRDSEANAPHPLGDLRSANGCFLLSAPEETHEAVSILLEQLERHMLQSVDVHIYAFEAAQIPDSTGVLLSAVECEALVKSTRTVEEVRRVVRTVEPAFFRECARHTALVDYYVDHTPPRLVCADPTVLVPSQGLEIAIEVRPTLNGQYIARIAGRYGRQLELGTREAFISAPGDAVYDLPQLHSQVFTSTTRVSGGGGGLLLGAKDSNTSSVRILVTFTTRTLPPPDSPFIPVGGWNSPPLALRAMPPQVQPKNGGYHPITEPPPDPCPGRRLALEGALRTTLGTDDLAVGEPRLAWFESWALPRGLESNRSAAAFELKETVLKAERQVSFELRAGAISLSKFSQSDLEALLSGSLESLDSEIEDALEFRAFGAVQADSSSIISSMDEISFVSESRLEEYDNFSFSDPATGVLQDGYAATVSALGGTEPHEDVLTLDVEVHLQRRVRFENHDPSPSGRELTQVTVQGELRSGGTDWNLIGTNGVAGDQELFVAILRRLEENQ